MFACLFGFQFTLMNTHPDIGRGFEEGIIEKLNNIQHTVGHTMVAIIRENIELKRRLARYEDLQREMQRQREEVSKDPYVPTPYGMAVQAASRSATQHST